MSQRRVSQPKPDTGSTNPDKNANVLDAPEALRASPDASEPDERMNVEKAGMDVEKQEEDDDSPLSNMSDVEAPIEIKESKSRSKTVAASKKGGDARSRKTPATSGKDTKATIKEPQFLDPEADGDEEADEEEIQAALSRPPPVNSDYLPLPWKGRLGYVRRMTSMLRSSLTKTRLVFALTFASRIRLYLARELVVLLPSSKIDILSKTLTSRLMQPRTDQIKTSLPTFLVGKHSSRVLEKQMQRTLSRC